MSDKSSSSSSSSGIGFVGLLAIVFIALKLVGILDWSWWWVLSPIWIGAIVGVTVCVAVIAFTAYAGGRKRGR